jgi:hypothetical protein
MLKGSFQLRTDDQVWGTPTYSAFVYQNSDAVSVHFSIGNGRDDGYRFHSRPPARELNPYYEMGGLAPVVELSPGQSGQDEILLNRYLQFLTPGAYVVLCELDLEVLYEDSHTRNRPEFRTELTLNLRDDPGTRQKKLKELEASIMQTGESQLPSADALAELRSAEALPILARGLHATSLAVVEKMIIGLGNTGGEPAMKALRDFVKTNPSPLLLRLAKQELATLGG